MIPYFKAYLIKHEKIVDVREINYNLLEIGWRDDDFHDTVSSFDDIKFIQPTGLLDKNGKEIYEGDILHHKVQGTGVVFYPYRDTMASFGIRNVNTNFGRNLQDTAKAGYEVIGNKFEHPHLLGED
ncbi:YopX family protein [Mammaliicoccus sciuri]|uniref:YopX family protein n=1 Tax=Mammaliicoccus sciuri TaxID=1296 RepID=UPI00209D5155|nr:YopX family protein [Mammaliicoccus sciuri]MCP1288316.1 YopX family protein [Mammaliicoccus sciuri]